MKKVLVILMAAVMVFAMAGLAMAKQEDNSAATNPNYPKGNIVANEYNTLNSDFNYYEQGVVATSTIYDGYIRSGETTVTSTHVQGTWNSPYTTGIDGYNYNDSQDYITTGEQTETAGKLIFQSGPHGGYLTSTHRCRECHAVHRAAGKFKLLRSDTRFEACDWCHGTGAGSGFNIQMDNDSGYTEEYNVGHTMGFGISSNKWKAPDDTFPAFTPNYYMGGFSCFDCHSPHANPSRMLGFDGAGNAYGLPGGVQRFGIANPGHDMFDGDTTHIDTRPIYLSGSWLLIKNPDREIAVVGDDVDYFNVYSQSTVNTDLVVGQEISDLIFARTDSTGTIVTAGLTDQFTGTDGGAASGYPVNKLPIDWDSPIGAAGIATSSDPNPGFSSAGTTFVWSVSEFCTDCHDGNAGQHTVEAPLFSEDRALRDTVPATNTASGQFRGSYDLAYGHDAQPRHTCERQMVFNPEDGNDFGPNCRNCHKGSSACNTCHAAGEAAWPVSANDAYLASAHTSAYDASQTSTGIDSIGIFYKKSQTVAWDSDWRAETGTVDGGQISAPCSDDGFSWPHRTLGWKMLKDDLFGLDFIGPEGTGRNPSEPANDGIIAVGESRMIGGTLYEAHDIDSVCLDCHNPTIWNASSTLDHEDDPADDANAINDNMDDELILRGLP